MGDGNLSSKIHVVPVDREHTGQIQTNTQLGHGLQQFLEIAQQLPITPLSVVSAFQNNIQFFAFLQNIRLFGVTGTLGSPGERAFLERTYNVDTELHKPHKPSKFERCFDDDIFCFEQEQWFESLCTEVSLIKTYNDEVEKHLLKCYSAYIGATNNMRQHFTLTIHSLPKMEKNLGHKICKRPCFVGGLWLN